jgi:hypothetical protein
VAVRRGLDLVGVVALAIAPPSSREGFRATPS